MQIRAVVDRFEGDKAVLLIGDGESTAVWPRSCLPAEAREGDILSFALLRDEEATRQARDEAAELLRQLTQKQG